MAGKAGHPPIIVIGMHRSGTSMITQMLEQLGLFVGEKKSRQNEALFFLRLNDWLLHQSGANWDHPEPVRNLLRHPEVRALATDYIRQTMSSPSVTNYLGWSNYLRYRTPRKMEVRWGWKDPRTTYTLPLWLDLFPEAKVVHVYRHGADIANSLKVRETYRLARTNVKYRRRKPLYWIRPQQARVRGSIRCTDLDGAFELWLSYAEEARAHVARLGDRAMELKYEDFLEEPYRHLVSLARFCEMPDNNELTASICKNVNKDRAYAYRSNPELRAVAERYAPQLGKWGYG